MKKQKARKFARYTVHENLKDRDIPRVEIIKHTKDKKVRGTVGLPITRGPLGPFPDMGDGTFFGVMDYGKDSKSLRVRWDNNSSIKGAANRLLLGLGWKKFGPTFVHLKKNKPIESQTIGAMVDGKRREFDNLDAAVNHVVSAHIDPEGQLSDIDKKLLFDMIKSKASQHLGSEIPIRKLRAIEDR